MQKQSVERKIENTFRKQVQSDKKLSNAYLLIQSDKLNIDLNIAEGNTDGKPANHQQANYMASVGKLFTSVIISMLYEKGELGFEDSIEKHIENSLLKNLHVYKNKEYSTNIQVRHLLNQTSGLFDCFWPLSQKLTKEPNFSISPREAISWGKENMKAHFPPGKKHFYSDTNYYLLGLIIENITKKPFHQVLSEFIFEPLNMNNSYMNGYSKPKQESGYPTAKVFFEGTDVLKLKGFPGIDYAGGGVVAPMNDLLKFIKALAEGKILQEKTLQIMMQDDDKLGVGIRYGYGIWKFVTVPIIMPAKFNCWGCVGVTGAYMFHHPKTDSFIIGNFNDLSYRSKALRFMLMKVIKPLLKVKT